MHRMSCIHATMWRPCSHASPYIKGAYSHCLIWFISLGFSHVSSDNQPFVSTKASPIISSITSLQPQPSISTSQHHSPSKAFVQSLLPPLNYQYQFSTIRLKQFLLQLSWRHIKSTSSDKHQALQHQGFLVNTFN